MKRETHSVTLEVQAGCDECAWCSTALNSLGNAARHHDATKHAVTVDVTRRITYGHQPTPEELGQTTIEDLAP